MPGSYLPDEMPDLEDFFAQIVPTPPPTGKAGGVLFMAPFDPSLDLWFAYVRHGTRVERFDGTEVVVRNWAWSQDVAERWVFAAGRAAHVPWPDPQLPHARRGCEPAAGEMPQ